MRLQKQLNEMISIKKWENMKVILDKDCKPYIDLLKGTKYLLLRGVKSMPSYMDKKSVRRDRRPRMIDKGLHDKLGEYTKKKFGWNTRQEGLFTTMSKLDASKWGKPSIVFPIGDFKHVLNVNVEELYGLYDYWAEDYWDDIKREVDYYKTDKDSLVKYLTYGSGFISECIINCNQYYSINYEWFDTLHQWYSERKYEV